MTNTRQLMAVVMMSTLIVVLGFIPAIPLSFIPVPIVFQNMGIMLAAVLLGGRLGTWSVLLFALMGMAIPTFSGGNTLLTVLAGPSAGYVLAWLLVPALYQSLCSLLSIDKTISKNWLGHLFVLWLTGVLWVDVIGSIWLAFYTKTPLWSALLTNIPFLVGDSLKVILALVIGSRLINRVLR